MTHPEMANPLTEHPRRATQTDRGTAPPGGRSERLALLFFMSALLIAIIVLLVLTLGI
jgi:hypothetical protein